MSIWIKVAGVWKDATPKIKVAGVWKTVSQVSVKVAGVWRDCLSSGPTINTAAILSNNNDNSGTCEANVKIDSDTYYYRSTYSGTMIQGSQWLTAGAVSQVWVQRTINSGSLTTDGIGAGRVACTADRTVGVFRGPITGTKSCTLTFYFYDAASGGNLLASKQITVSATNLGGGVGGCPLCCFTPDTMISVP